MLRQQNDTQLDAYLRNRHDPHAEVRWTDFRSNLLDSHFALAGTYGQAAEQVDRYLDTVGSGRGTISSRPERPFQVKREDLTDEFTKHLGAAGLLARFGLRFSPSLDAPSDQLRRSSLDSTSSSAENPYNFTRRHRRGGSPSSSRSIIHFNPHAPSPPQHRESRRARVGLSACQLLARGHEWHFQLHAG